MPMKRARSYLMAKPELNIGGYHVGGGNPCLIIAEIGTSHGGDLTKARELISRAVESGADCVKSQAVFAEEIIHPLTGIVDLPTGAVPLYERFEALEQSEDFFLALKEHTEACGALFLCSPFGIRSARMLRAIGCKAFKIASPELNHFQLLEEVASYGLPLILSCGVSCLGDIEKALLRIQGPCALLHCITAYPAPEEEYNLSLIENLMGIFGQVIGISDHSLDPILVPALGRAFGAGIIEKHLTLSREARGLDDPIALEPRDFARMVRAVRKAEDLGKEEVVRWLSGIYGEQRISSTIGDGVKRLSPSEIMNYGRTNRSIHALIAIRKGDVFTEKTVGVLRTEKVLRPGISPDFFNLIIGKKAMRDIPAGEGVVWEDILP